MIKKLTRLERRHLILILSIAVSGVFAQCENVGFELGTTANWTCGSGTYGKPNLQDCHYAYPLVINYDGNCLNEAGINGTNVPSNPKQNRHVIMTTAAGKDPNSSNALSCVAPASMFPDGVNNYSFRLGNAVALNMASLTDSLALVEGIKFKLNVTSSNAGLTYMFALLIKEGVPFAHPGNQSPRFIVKILDANNQVIDCSTRLIVTGPDGPSSLKAGVIDATGQWRYTDWAKVQLNLTPYIGQSITIEFITGDC